MPKRNITSGSAGAEVTPCLFWLIEVFSRTRKPSFNLATSIICVELSFNRFLLCFLTFLCWMVYLLRVMVVGHFFIWLVVGSWFGWPEQSCQLLIAGWGQAHLWEEVRSWKTIRFVWLSLNSDPIVTPLFLLLPLSVFLSLSLYLSISPLSLFLSSSRGMLNMLTNIFTSPFLRRFSDKTRNQWSDRDNFEKVPGKYDLLAIDYSAKVSWIDPHGNLKWESHQVDLCGPSAAHPDSEALVDLGTGYLAWD